MASLAHPTNPSLATSTSSLESSEVRSSPAHGSTIQKEIAKLLSKFLMSASDDDSCAIDVFRDVSAIDLQSSGTGSVPVLQKPPKFTPVTSKLSPNASPGEKNLLKSPWNLNVLPGTSKPSPAVSPSEKNLQKSPWSLAESLCNKYLARLCHGSPQHSPDDQLIDVMPVPSMQRTNILIPSHILSEFISGMLMLIGRSGEPTKNLVETPTSNPCPMCKQRVPRVFDSLQSPSALPAGKRTPANVCFGGHDFRRVSVAFQFPTEDGIFLSSPKIDLRRGSASASDLDSSYPVPRRRLDSVWSESHRMPVKHNVTADLGQDFDGSVTVNQYVILQQIGAGRQGEVSLAFDTESNEYRAIKSVDRQKLRKNAFCLSMSSSLAGIDDVGEDTVLPDRVASIRSHLQHRRFTAAMMREINVMKKCRHKNVVALYEVIDDPGANHLYLVMQYVEHGAIVKVSKDGKADHSIPPDELISYARQLLAALQYLHNHDVIHRDIKCENILLGAENTVFLSDFGVAEFVDVSNFEGSILSSNSVTSDPSRSGSCTSKIPSRNIGTVAFMAPEVLREKTSVPPKMGVDNEVPSTVGDKKLSVSSEAGLSELSTFQQFYEANEDYVDGRATDVWSLGLSLYIMLFGQHPFSSDISNGKHAYLEAIKAKEVCFPCHSQSTTLARNTNELESENEKEEEEGAEVAAKTPHTKEVSPSPAEDGIKDSVFVPKMLPCKDSQLSLEVQTQLEREWTIILKGMLEKNASERWTVEKARQEVKRVDSLLDEERLRRKKSLDADFSSPAITLRRLSRFNAVSAS